MIEYAELCAKTNFSLLAGASRPEEMVAAAKEAGLFAVAIADRNGLYGSVRAHIAAKKSSQRYIVGAELPLYPASPKSRSSARTKAISYGEAILLAEDHAGYRNLCRLLTLAHADLPREEAWLELSALAEHAEGLVLILDLPAPWGGASSEARPVLRDEKAWGAAREAFRGRAYLATTRNLAPDAQEREAYNVAIAHRLDLPMIATARPLFHHPSRKPIADVLQCIRERMTLDQAGSRLSANAEAYLRSPEHMARLFHDAKDRLERTVEIAASTSFSLGHLRYAFPSDDTLPGETPDAALRRLTGEGVRDRYPQGIPSAVASQIQKELALIARMGVAQFFLSVYEIVKIARSKRILCQGRGSAANSAVCYVLGITAVDPARSSLLFERFLSAERNEPPDIDVDFEHERREEVIQAIYEKYGRDRAAMVSEVICYRGRSALRETGKAFGLSLEQCDRLAQMSGPYDSIEIGEQRVAEAGFDPHDRRIQLVVQIAAQIQGFPRHMSTHVGGFVLSACPIDEVSPTEPAKIPGRTVVPWDKDDIDALGFFKVDVLGLGMLTAIRKTLELVHARTPSASASEIPRGEFDPIQALARIPPEKPEVYDAICKADTIGVFQIESRAQMAMLPRMRPRKFYDLVIEVAIVRPGPIQGGMVHPYLRRRNGEEPKTLPHPSLASILDRTLGVPLFQEQVMEIAIVGAGYTAGEADELRRDMAAWRRDGRLLRHREKLLSGFTSRGISEEFAEKLFSQIKGFGEYGFPESHAASFALLVYTSAWLKVHYPAQFACALLNSQPMGFYSPSSIVRDAQKHGVTVLAPDVQKSDWDSTIVPETNALQLGFRLIKGFGEDAARRIVAARSEAPLSDLKDLRVRAGLRTDQLEALAEAGTVLPLEAQRRQAMWQARAPSEGELFEPVPSNEPEAALPPLLPVEQLRLDYGRLGLSVSDHPLRHLRKELDRRGVIRSDALTYVAHGAPVRVAGLVLSRQRPGTASGVVFVTLEDECGMVNLILQSDVFERFHRVAVHSRMLWADGKVERTPRKPPSSDGSDDPHPVIHVLVRRLEALGLPGGLAARSRDFR
jgi:error-prone DNA polymerase